MGLYEDLKAAKAGDKISLVLKEHADIFYWTVPTTDAEAAIEASNILLALIEGGPKQEMLEGLDIYWDASVQYELIGEEEDGYGARFYVSGTFGPNYKPPVVVAQANIAGVIGVLLATGFLLYGSAVVIDKVNVAKMTPEQQIELAEADPSLAKAAIEFKGVVLAALGLVLLRQMQKMRGAAAGE